MTSYQEMAEQLDSALVKLQGPDVDIDEATKLFEQAMELTQKMETYLQSAENKITQLKVKFNGDAK